MRVVEYFVGIFVILLWWILGVSIDFFRMIFEEVSFFFDLVGLYYFMENIKVLFLYGK